MSDETLGSPIIPSEVPEAENATLALEEKDGTYVLKATGASALPASITVVDAAGNAVALYAAWLPNASTKYSIRPKPYVVELDEHPLGSLLQDQLLEKKD
ncbi:hypothetical protein [Streptomyces sp. NPDC002209]|uniref:hypothetical protein n=1 Tax=Streptomyces sp. NPDC002209 TaxID=3364638 RepID=UPI0036A5DD74